MRFRVQHTFHKISVQEYEKLYFDDEFNIALCGAVKLSREPVELHNDGKNYKRILKVGPDRQLPKPLAKILKTDRLFYKEYLDYAWGRFTGQWKTIPMVLPDKVVSEGTFSFSESGSSVVRVVEGEIAVKVLGVGSVIERYIVEDVKRSYEDAAQFTQSWIRSNASA